MESSPSIVVAIMAGGAGTRFWPISTEKKPKQFLSLWGERSLLQRSFDRVSGMVPSDRIFVLTSEWFIPLVREQLPEIPMEHVLGEPARRDTAAAIAWVSLLCRERFGNPTMAILTADHVIETQEGFQRTLRCAARAASENPKALYTFGIPPTYPATGFGYLERGDPLPSNEGVSQFYLKQFHEKPNLATAEAYVASRHYFWNSGMFVWTTDAILQELERQLPEHVDRLKPLARTFPGFCANVQPPHTGSMRRENGNDANTQAWHDAFRLAFSGLHPISIDFGVMEHARDVRCIVADFSWDDVGGWLALDKYLSHDSNLNAHRGRIQTEEAAQNLVFCADETEFVSLIGIENVIVVRAGKTTLVAHKERAESIKQLVAKLAADDR